MPAAEGATGSPVASGAAPAPSSDGVFVFVPSVGWGCVTAEGETVVFGVDGQRLSLDSSVTTLSVTASNGHATRIDLRSKLTPASQQLVNRVVRVVNALRARKATGA